MPALTLVLTFRLLAFDFALLLFLAVDVDLFMIGLPGLGSHRCSAGQHASNGAGALGEQF